MWKYRRSFTFGKFGSLKNVLQIVLRIFVFGFIENDLPIIFDVTKHEFLEINEKFILILGILTFN